jgi:serine/threonine protein kinase
MKMIGRYAVRGQLGRGGMSRVYKVEMPVTGKIAALKRLEPNPLLVDLMGMEAVRELFVTEAVIVANLRHPHVTDIWDFDEEEDKPFYLMDYYCNNLGVMIGETYETEKPSRIIKTDRAIHYIRQILLGLDRLHHAGIIHRDIKPFNILITDHDAVKICDFGLSKLRGEVFQGPPQLKVGTPWYAAPEQEENPDTVGYSADLFSVGIMLYRMLTGILPMENPKPASRFNPDLDKDWDAFLFKAMEPRPQDRFRRTRSMLAALDTIISDWEAEKERICRLPPEETIDFPSPESLNQDRRKQPIKVRPRVARERFSLDELWRPRAYIQNQLETGGNGIIFDRTTGLAWERSGSEYPLTWHEANTYIDELNRNRCGGHTDWRLPTVDELTSLITKTPHGRSLCIEPVFDSTQKQVWSSDRRSHIAAWYVSIVLGFVAWQDFTGYYYVRGVRG